MLFLLIIKAFKKPLERQSVYKANQCGFSLLELAVSLVVIGLIMGMVAVSSNLQRSASYSNILSSFVLAWSDAYSTYFDQTGFVVGDYAPASGKVDYADNSELCDTSLTSVLIPAGVEMPSGRARDYEYYALYQAPDNVQRQIEVCFVHLTDWFVGPLATDTTEANVMVIKNLTTDLARKIDAEIDSYADAAWGDFRSTTDYNSSTSVVWDDLYDGSGNIVTVNAYLKMAN